MPSKELLVKIGELEISQVRAANEARAGGAFWEGRDSGICEADGLIEQMLNEILELEKREVAWQQSLDFAGTTMQKLNAELQEAERQRGDLLVALESLRPTCRNPNCFCLGSHDLRMYGHSSACRFATAAIAAAKGESRG